MRKAAVEITLEISGGAKGVTVGADRSDDTQVLIVQMKKQNVTPHGVQNGSGQRSAVDGKTRWHEG